MNTHFLYDPSLHGETTLDLGAVRELIAGRCLNEGARETVRMLRPSTERVWIERRMRECAQMRSLIDEVGDPQICSTGFAAAIEAAIRQGAVIAAEELRELLQLERTVVELRRRFKNAGEQYGSVTAIIEELIPHPQLVARIERCVGEDGEILDKASPTLAQLRKSITSAREKLRSEAERLASGYGDNAYATILDNRFKLLIPRDRYRRSDGIIHSKSHSGGSLYFEPIGMVARNNELETVIHDEQAEVARILQELTAQVVAVVDEVRSNIATIERLDTLRAKALFSMRFGCITPEFAERRELTLVRARHPLLELTLERERAGPDSSGDDHDAGQVVPLDISLTEDAPVLVITGPNAGGKTVALKTIGLTVLLCQCGLQVPCGEGTKLPLFEKLFVDIGDEQSIAASLSTFTSHLQHLDMMCREADAGSLCLVDEIGDGTDPDEGAALANATLDNLLAAGAMVVATTHYGKVKTHAMSTAGVENASMLFDDDTHEPLYTLMQGVVGRSRGLETAHRCGFEPAVLEQARRYLGEKAFQLEALLTELERSHRHIEGEREALKSQSQELADVIKIYSERERTLRELQERHSEETLQETEELLRHARREVERIVKNIRESGARKREIKEGHRKIREMIDRADRAKKSRKPEPAAPALELQIGDMVSIHESGSPAGRVVELQNRSATIEINGKRIKINREGLFKAAAPAREKKQITYDIEYEPLGSTSLDVRGQEREEALESVDRFLDQALLNGVREVKIVHGIGEGILSQAIRDQLQVDSRVAVFRPGRMYEGGDGVSLVTLA